MDLLLGGDLRYHIARKRKFTEEETKFFIGCLVQALEVVHGCGIIHRDIKPENLVFDSDGYLRLTDFGIARYWSPDNA
jgi:serine/threonine protein kinase